MSFRVPASVPLTIRLEEPQVEGQVVRFSWSCDPETDFYRRSHFSLEFPAGVDVASVPEGLWLRVMMICLHSHWMLLRPCRVEIPRTLPGNEREFWLRLIDAATWTHEFDRAPAANLSRSEPTRREVEIVDFGPPAGKLLPAGDSGVVVASFSGGRDSLTQLGMLQEAGLNPLLVTTTSRREGSFEFETERFRRVLAETQERTGAELVEVKSDIRDCWMNNHPTAARYRVAVSELTDVLVYFSVCWATAWARGATDVFLGGEAEVQESVRADGGVAQVEHFAYAASTQIALSALAAPTGIANYSLISSLEHFQIHRVLGQRYPELRGLQYSCFQQQAGENVCSRCYSCFKSSLYLLSEDIAPAEIELDVNRALSSQPDWAPSDGRSSHTQTSVGRRYVMRMDDHLVRVLRRLDPERVAELAPAGRLSSEAAESLARLRATALAADDPPPEPGYRRGYVELLDEPLRGRIDAILSDHFEPAEPGHYLELLENTKMLGDWLVAPLAR